MDGYVAGWMSEVKEGDTIAVEFQKPFDKSKAESLDTFFGSNLSVWKQPVEYEYLDIKVVRMWNPPYAEQLEDMPDSYKAAIQIQQRANVVSFIGEMEGVEQHFSFQINHPCYIKVPEIPS